MGIVSTFGSRDDEVKRLIRFLLRSKDGFAIGFARGPGPAKRAPVIDEVSEALAEKGMTLRIADFSDQPITNLFDHLSRETTPSETGQPIIVVGLESAIFADNGELFLQVLNLDRDRFRRCFIVPILFWLSPAAADRLQSDAHDFYDYWTGLFDFTEPDIDTPADPEERRAQSVSFTFQIRLPEDEQRYLNEEIRRHQEIVDGLSPLSKIIDERARLRAIDSLRILARDEGRIGQIDVAKSHIAQTLALMPPLPRKPSSPGGAAPDETPSKESTSAISAAIQAWADYGRWLSDQMANRNMILAMTLMSDHQETLIATVKEALDLGMPAAAQSVLQPLVAFWELRGMYREVDAWADTVRRHLESPAGTPPDAYTVAGALWIFVMDNQASRRRAEGKLDEAEKIYLGIQKMLEASGGATARTLAPIYHNLGMIAQGRGDLDQAEVWYQKSLEIEEALSNRLDMASTYHQLGTVAEERGDLDQAEVWHLKSLEIKTAIDNQLGMVSSYYQLGRIAGERGALDQAEAWHLKSLEMEEALDWRPGMASTYHQLGRVAEERGNLDQAEVCYKKSLEIYNELGDWYGLAQTYAQMAFLAEKQGRAQEALDWTVRCVGLFADFPHPYTGPGPKNLARLTRALGPDALESAWLRCHGVPLPDAVRRGIADSS